MSDSALIVGYSVFALLAMAASGAALYSICLGLAIAWRLLTPDHWVFLLPKLRRGRRPWSVFTRPGGRALGHRQERHPETVRRLAGFGPFIIYAVRYAPGTSDETKEIIP